MFPRIANIDSGIVEVIRVACESFWWLFIISGWMVGCWVATGSSTIGKITVVKCANNPRFLLLAWGRCPPISCYETLEQQISTTMQFALSQCVAVLVLDDKRLKLVKLVVNRPLLNRIPNSPEPQPAIHSVLSQFLNDCRIFHKNKTIIVIQIESYTKFYKIYRKPYFSEK